MKELQKKQKLRWNELLEKYFKQSKFLPKRILGDLKKEEIVLYGMFDFSQDHSFSENWIVCTRDKLHFFFENGKHKSFSITKISNVREVKSLSVFTYLFENTEGEIIESIQFTSRQKIALGHIKYFIENRTKKFFETIEIDPHRVYQESVLRPLLDAQNETSDKKSGTLIRLLSYLKPYKKEVAIGGLGAVLATMVALVPAFLTGTIIDKVVRPFQDGALDAEEASSMALILVAGLGFSYLLREIFMWMRLKFMSVLGEKVARDLRDELYAHIQSLGMDFFSKRHTGSLITRVSSDTDRLFDFIAFGVVEFSVSTLMLTGLAGMLLYLDWRLGLVMTIPVPIFLYAIYKHGVHITRIFLKAWRKWSEVTRLLSDTIPGIQVVKAFNQEKKEISRFRHRNQVVTEEFNDIHKSWTKFWPTLMFGIHLCIFSVWTLGMPRLLTPEGTSSHLSAGTFVSFLLYMTMFIGPVEVIGNISRILNRALSSAFRVFEILDTRPTLVESDNPVHLKEMKGDIEFQDVFFSYDGVRQILKGMNFNIKAGEMIGLVGPSGGGKSTITKLISRFYDANSGSVKVDGIDVKDLSLGEFRKRIGIVLQDPYLFHGSVFENIRYGNDIASKAEVIRAAKMAQAHEFIINLSYGYDTVIGERGHSLSGGERQRISIARAILSNPKILILDEATSAVDTETERKIQIALENLVEGRTVLAVAHRLSTLRKANRLFVIKKGNLVEQGTHEELMVKKGVYAKLKGMQEDHLEEEKGTSKEVRHGELRV